MREKSDPIERVKQELLERGTDEGALKDVEKDIRKLVSEAADFAEQTPEPELSELYTDVLVGKY